MDSSLLLIIIFCPIQQCYVPFFLLSKMIQRRRMKEKRSEKNARTAHKQTARWHDSVCSTVIIANGNNVNRRHNEHDKEQIYVCMCMFTVHTGLKKWHAACNAPEVSSHELPSVMAFFLRHIIFSSSVCRPLLSSVHTQNGSILDFNQSLAIPLPFFFFFFRLCATAHKIVLHIFLLAIQWIAVCSTLLRKNALKYALFSHVLTRGCTMYVNVESESVFILHFIIILSSTPPLSSSLWWRWIFYHLVSYFPRFISFTYVKCNQF